MTNQSSSATEARFAGTVQGVLLDIEGVLFDTGEPVPGAPAAVRRLADAGIAIRYLTNTTTAPRRAIAARLADGGFAAAAGDVFCPAQAAARRLGRDGTRRLHLAAPAALAEDFDAFELVDARPQAIVVGDLYTDFTWARLNGLAQMIWGGARLVALHRNRYCRRAAEGLALDLGPFVAALEYATGREALVVGKPAPGFFALAVDDLGVARARAIMVGDDIEADIGGGAAAGLRTVQVRTGKYRPEAAEAAAVRPDAVIDSIAALPALLGLG